jgi:hypothetical protein
MAAPGSLHTPLAGLFLLGSIGTAAELVLLEHTEDAWQIVPLGLLSVGWVLLGVLVARPSLVTARMFQTLMIAFVSSGLVGVGLHYNSNVEFERELQPDAAGWFLTWEALKGATPALAPGAMMLLGGIGWLVASTTRR